MSEPTSRAATTALYRPAMALTSPTVSVIIPTYNFGNFVEDAVSSVLKQDVPGIEVIVVDDGSTDDTVERLARIADPRLRTVRLEHQGVGAARNRGLSMARGRHIAFLDADDRWRPGKLARQIALLESEPDVGFVFTNFVRFDERGFHPETQFDLVPELAALPTRPSADGRGHVIAGDSFCSLVPLTQLPCWTQTMLIRGELARGHEFPVDMRLSQDLFYVLNTYRVANGAYIDDPLVEVRRHSSNSYLRADVKLLPDIDALTRTLPLATSPPHRAALRRRLGRAWLGAGYHFLRAGNPRLAVRAYCHALAYPDVRLRAVTRLLATPFAPVASLLRRRETAPFPGTRS